MLCLDILDVFLARMIRSVTRALNKANKTDVGDGFKSRVTPRFTPG